VGRLLDANLETSAKNLYCYDTSVLPEAPGVPPALTLVVLAKRLARRLEGRLGPRDRLRCPVGPATDDEPGW
jgi:choline dehydrogenase-like flavoprotein